MGKEFEDQHIVPKRYLDRFASKNGRKRLIGTRYYGGNKVTFFLTSTSSVGYIKDYYDVKDKDDPKYWEHFFAEKIDTLCGTEMGRIICTITLSQNTYVLDNHDKETLSKIIIAQMMRIPSSIDRMEEIYSRVEREFNENYLSVLPDFLRDKCQEIVKSKKLDKQWQKEQFFNFSFAPENFDKYCRLLQDDVWIVYVNAHRSFMPFTTSDNPVLVEGIGKKEIGLFKNGLTDPATCLFYPISPSIAIAIYSNHGIMGLVAEKWDGKRVPLNDLKFIINKNIKIMEQAYHHSFIPQPLFNEIMNKH